MLRKIINIKGVLNAQRSMCFGVQGFLNNRSMSAFVNHRDTEDNVEETPFEFT